MYKTTSERQSCLERVASHSTKGRGGGLVTVLPPRARPEEAVYRDAYEQYGAACKQRKALEDEIVAVNVALRNPELSGHDVGRLKTRREELVEAISLVENHLKKLKWAAWKAANDSWTATFHEIAEAMLTPELFMQVEEATIVAMGRHRNSPGVERKGRIRDRKIQGGLPESRQASDDGR